MTDLLKRSLTLLGVALTLTTAFAAATLAQSVAESALSETFHSTALADATRTRYALMRSGVVWEGRIVDRGDSYGIEFSTGGSVTASKLDVLFIGDTRESVFAFKVGETRMEDANEVLKLADWASRRQLGAEAIKLLNERLAIAVDDAERRALRKKLDALTLAEKFRAEAARVVDAYEDRKNARDPEVAEKHEQNDPQKSQTTAVDAELDAWGRTLAPTTLERFSRKAAPALQKRCATADCHAEGAAEARYRTRPKAFGAAQRLALLYTLRETIAYVDFNNIDASPILNHPTVTNAFGERVYPFGADRHSAKDCANFIEWLKTLKDEPRLAQAAQDYRSRRVDAAIPREGAASRYDVVDAPNRGGVVENAASASTGDERGFAKLIDESLAERRAEPSAPVFQQGIVQESERFMPKATDDVNSTESRLERVGMLPRKSYRDEYDPSIFNDRYHPSASTPRTEAPSSEQIDVVATDDRGA